MPESHDEATRWKDCGRRRRDPGCGTWHRHRPRRGGRHGLLNDIWGGDDLIEWGKKLWETKLEDGLTLVDRAIKTHIITSYHGLPRLRAGGLVVEITDGDAYFYRGHFFYDLVKTTVIRMAFALSQELKERGIPAVAVTPGSRPAGRRRTTASTPTGRRRRTRRQGEVPEDAVGDSAWRRCQDDVTRGADLGGQKLRAGIRAHRDSTGHELCWHHPALWGLLPEGTPRRPDSFRTAEGSSAPQARLELATR